MSKECSECSRTTSNKYFNCAPHMSDGRNFTDYRPRCVANFQHFPNNSVDNAAPSSYEYRQYLIKNADEMMKKNRQAAYQANMCGPCMSPYNEGTMAPEQTKQKCNSSTCTFYENNANGVGLGRDQGQGGSQAAFLAAKEAEQKMIGNMENCCAAPGDDLNYYPFDYKVSGVINERPSVPSGGSAMAATDRR